MMFDGFRARLRVPCVAVDRYALNCPFNVLFCLTHLIRKEMRLTLCNDREAIRFKNKVAERPS